MRYFKSLPAATAALGMTLALVGCDKGAETETPEPTADTAPAAEPEAKAEPEKVYPKPPSPDEPRPVNFPELQKFKLPNQMEVIVVENHEVPLVDVQVVVKAGDVFGELEATMTAAMLSEGTKKKTKAKVDAEIEQMGSSINAGSSNENAYVSTRLLTTNLDKGLKLLSEVVQTPRFDAAALDKLKEQQKEGLKAAKSSGQSLGQTLVGMRVYPDGHPYGRPFLTDEEIDKITVDELKKFHDTWYRPNNAYVILSGDITKDQAEKLVKKTFGKWKPAAEFPSHPLDKFSQGDYQAALPKGDEPMTVHIVDRKSVSVEIFVANLALARNSPDWDKFSVVNRLFGAGISSRLFQDIRETRQLTYNVGSFVAPAKAVGAFGIATQTKKVDEMMDALFGHIDRIRTTDPTAEECENIREGVARSFPLGIETAGQVASRVNTVLTYQLADDYWNGYRDRVRGLECGEFKTLASKYIHEVPVVVMVGRAKRIKKMLKDVDRLKDANVVVYDTDLKVIEGK